MFYSADVRHERFWRVGIARNAVFFRSSVASKARKGRSEKRGGAEDRLPKMSTKFAPRLRARAIWNSKSLKLEGLGGLFEVRVAKIGTTPARENDLEGRRRDFDTLQNTWQAQEFVRVAKTLAGVVDLKRVGHNAFRVAGTRISCFVMSMFEASDAESVDGLQISCHGSGTLQ